jgi:hypothetical protein
MNTEHYHELLGKLAVNIANTNNEGVIRANADALLTGRINALEKITAEDFAELSTKIDTLRAEIAALKAQNDAVALAYDVANMKSVLTQLLAALAEDEEADDGEHSLEQVKTAYLAIVGADADELTIAHIEMADTLADTGKEYRLINTTQGRDWTISKELVAELLAKGDAE